MSTSRVAETLAKDLAADPFFGDVLASLHLHPKRQVDLQRAVELRELAFSEFCGGCGSRWSYWR
jgi:hypothetical protein